MKNYPLKSIAICFSCGILLQHNCDFPADKLIVSSGIIFLITLLTFILRRIHHSPVFITLCLYLTVLILSASSYALARMSVKQYPFTLQKIKEVRLSGRISAVELIRDYEIRFFLDADSVLIRGVNVPLEHKVICRIRDSQKRKLDSLYSLIYPGNYVSAEGVISKAREKRNPGEFDYQAYQEEKGISAVFTAYNAEDLTIKSHYKFFSAAAVFSLRKGIDYAIMDLHSKETGALLRGVLLADRSSIGEDIQIDFMNTGVVHILAVSGSNVAFLMLILSVISGRFPFKIRLFIMLLGIVFFLTVTGLSPSVVRAALMASLVIAAYYTGRSRDVLNALSLSAIVMLLFNPLDLFDPGFQLSFVTVISIVLLTPYILSALKKKVRKGRLNDKALLIIAVTMSAQAGTLPFILYYFSKLSVVSVPANLIVIPIIGIISGGGIAALGLFYLWPWGAGIIAGADDMMTRLCYSVTSFLGNPDISFLSINHFSVYDAVIFYVAAGMCVVLLGIMKNRIAKIVLVLLTALIIPLLMSFDNKELLPEGKLSAVFIDVGQGDAALIKFPDGKTMLVDAGQADQFFDNGERVISPLLDYLGIGKVDIALISHIDNDHYAGLIPLIEMGRIKRIMKPEPDYTDRSSIAREIRFELFLRTKGIPFTYYDHQIIKLGSAAVYVLTGRAGQDYQRFENNDRSGVIKVVYGKSSILLTGDAGKSAEEYLIDKYGHFLKSDVLKAGHHGSHLSSTENFLDKVGPQLAVISSGYLNKFGHPSPEVLERLGERNAEVYRTDLTGALILQCDGNKITQINWREHLR